MPTSVTPLGTQQLISRLDHLVLTVSDLQQTITFYQDILGMTVVQFNGRYALQINETSKINLHLVGHEFEPKAQKPTVGSADLCFIVNQPLANVIETLQENNIPIELGPILRTGSCAKLLSVYVRDPNQNLIELSVEQNKPKS